MCLTTKGTLDYNILNLATNPRGIGVTAYSPQS